MTNTNMCVPMDMNVFDACMPELMRLQDIGRMVIGVVPTASFGPAGDPYSHGVRVGGWRVDGARKAARLQSRTGHGLRLLCSF